MVTTELWSIGLVGGAIGVSLAMPAFRLAPEAGEASVRSGRVLGAALFGVAVVQILIALRHGGLLPDPAAEHVVNVVGLSAAPLLVVWTRAMMEGTYPPRRHVVALWLPAVAYGLLVLQSPGRSVPFEWILPVAVGFTVAAAGFWARARATTRAGDAAVRLVGGVLGFALLLNVAQVVRTVWTDEIWLREVVPLTATVAFLALGSVAMGQLVRAHLGAGPVPAEPRYERSALDDAAAHSVLERLDAAMAERQLFTRPKLALAELAVEVDTQPALLSEALNRVRKIPLAEYLSRLRIEEARRQLSDPSNDTFTIEALAEASGFGSRSAFYKAFRRATGLTPTEFRTRIRSGFE